jgi:hypothetical protein
MIAEVLHVVAAEPAIAVYSAHPEDADARSHGQIRGCAFNQLADDLMAGDDTRQDWREVAFNDVQICAADATSEHLEQNVSGL